MTTRLALALLAIAGCTPGNGSLDLGARDLSVLPDGSGPPNGLPATFFGLAINRTSTAWPTVPFAALRLWDSQTSWIQLEPTAGNFQFATLDTWLTQAQAHGVDVLYTFGRVPTWSSSNPTSAICAYGAGQCEPPSDLNADGTGTNAAFKAFVTALVQHAGPAIKYYEVWNEVNNVPFWNGTAEQLVRMAQDARSIIKAAQPGAMVLTPSTCNCANAHLTRSTSTKTNPQDGMAYYLSTVANGVTGASQADAVAFHPYLGSPQPEGVVPLVTAMKTAMNAHGAGALPLWDTESSWGRDRGLPGCPANDMPPYTPACTSAMAAFGARSLTLVASLGVARFYWYGWDFGTGTLWDAIDGRLASADAYAKIAGWLTGSALSPCSARGTVWTCALVLPDRRPALVAWSASGVSSMPRPPGFSEYEDLGGVVHTPLPDPVPLGLSPVLLR